VVVGKLAILLSGLSLFISGMTLLTVLVLLGKHDFQYASQNDLHEIRDHLKILGSNQSKLWRYAEAIDDATDGSGHQVLIGGLRCDASPQGE